MGQEGVKQDKNLKDYKRFQAADLLLTLFSVSMTAAQNDVFR